MNNINKNDIIEVKNLVKQFKKVKAVNDIRFQ
jgi:hypothetical protein